MSSPRRSIPHLVLAGIFLSAIPALTLARQSFAAPSQIQLTLPATLLDEGGVIKAVTDINTLDLSQLAGNKNVAVGDVVYVHLNVDISQNDDTDYKLSYPYAISQNRPERSDARTISLRGVVSDRAGDDVSINYFFETLPANLAIDRAINRAAPKAEITVKVNRRAVGHINTVKINGLTYTINH